MSLIKEENKMIWTNTKDELPPERKYVLARHNRGTWIDEDDQLNVNCVVVKLVKGLSKTDRQLMKDGKLPSTKEYGTIYDNGELSKPMTIVTERYDVYEGADEDGNNLVPYKWETFGATSFFGQEITEWTHINK